MAHRVADRDEREARADDVLGPVHHLKSFRPRDLHVATASGLRADNGISEPREVIR